MFSPVPFEAKSASASSQHGRSLGRDAEAEPAERVARVVRCAFCWTTLALATDMMVMAGQHEHSFVNPLGFIFHIRCFTEARNVSTIGTPSSEFSWFPGHTWLILDCSVCGAHVGWRFDGESSRFFALIADRIADDVAKEA